MSELTKTKVIEIQTGQAVKNVDNLTSSFVPLKKQIRDLMNELTQLEQGTEQYNKVAQQLADLQQRQREAAEAAKYSSKDFGEVMSNLTKVSLGVAGGINAISASMALLGGDSEKMQKALAPIQLLMAAIQGVSAIDTAIKSLKGLNNMFESLGSTSEKAAESVTALGTDIDSIGDKDISLNVDTKKAEKSVTSLDKKIKSSTRDKKVKIDADTKKADKNIKGLETEIKSVGDKKVSIDADTTEATTKVEELKTEIETIPDKNINIDTDTTSVIESVEDVTESLEDMADIDIEVKAEGLDNVTKEVKNLGEAEKTLATNAQTATTATNNLNTATKSTAASTTAMATGAKTAAVASATLAAGEGVATKASWTLTGALKAVGTAIKSIPIIGWIAMGVTLLTQLIKLIVNANKESDAGEQIAQETLEAERKRRETLDEIYEKYRKIWNVMMDTLDILKEYPKDSREYKDALEDIASYLGVSKEFAASHADSLKKATDAAIELKKTEEQIKVNEEAWNKAGQDRENLTWDINDALQASWNTSNKILQNMVDERKITEDQMKKIQKARKDIINGEKTFTQAQKEATYIVQDRLNMYDDIQNQMVNENAKLKETVEDNKKIVYAVQNQSDAYDELLEKQKEGKKAAEEYYKKYLEAQKSYIELMEEMAISDAEYNGDWNRYADERKKKAERIYNDDLKEYQRQLKEKLITQEQYNNLLTQREEQYNNDTAQIALDTNKKMWDEQLNTAIEEIEKEKQARKKAYEEEYVVNVKANVSGAEDTRNIQYEQAELDAILKTNEVLKERLVIIQQNSDESKEYADYVKSLQDQIAENEQKAQELQLQIDLDGYEKRKKEAETYYAAIDQMAEDKTNQAIIDAGGNDSSQLEIKKQQIVIEAIRQKMDALRQMYDDGLIAEAEYYSRSQELNAQYVEAKKLLDKQQVESAMSTVGNLVNIYSMLSSSVGSILGEMMDNMDENSEEYKKMAIAQATIQTIAGSLGAFMSAYTSIPYFPANVIVGALLAATTTATGIAQIANIKSGKLGGNVGGNISSSASNLGRGEYETTAYTQNAELMSSVTDQRVYVLESDISSAQNNVSVMEADNTF